jgi:hypothetical protein
VPTCRSHLPLMVLLFMPGGHPGMDTATIKSTASADVTLANHAKHEEADAATVKRTALHGFALTNPANFEEMGTATVNPAGVTLANYEKIRSGMTKKEVVRLLGRLPDPPDPKLRDGPRCGTFPSIFIEDNGDSWRSETMQIQIWVVFNENGRVTLTMIAEWTVSAIRR